MADQVPRGPDNVPRNAYQMMSGPANKSGEFRLPRVSQLEKDIEEYLGLRRSLRQTEIPHEIRSIAEDRFKVLETRIQGGSIEEHEKYIEKWEKDKKTWPDLEGFLNERIAQYKQDIANMERARRIVAGAER